MLHQNSFAGQYWLHILLGGPPPPRTPARSCSNARVLGVRHVYPDSKVCRPACLGGWGLSPPVASPASRKGRVTGEPTLRVAAVLQTL